VLAHTPRQLYSWLISDVRRNETMEKGTSQIRLSAPPSKKSPGREYGTSAYWECRTRAIYCSLKTIIPKKGGATFVIEEIVHRSIHGVAALQLQHKKNRAIRGSGRSSPLAIYEKTEPNQPPEPTPTAVTPLGAGGAAQPVGALILYRSPHEA